MSITIKDLDPKDYDTARQFAIEGMNLSRYTDHAYELYFYSKYFLYMELLKATQILAAYDGGKLVGVLIAEMKNEKQKVSSFWMKVFVKSMEFIINLYENSQTYVRANKEMFEQYIKDCGEPDGEIIFFVVDTKLKGKGIGTLLLKEFEKIEKGKKIFLYTDTGCTYQFYEKRNFKREQEREIRLDNNDKEIPLTCFLYSKNL